MIFRSTSPSASCSKTCSTPLSRRSSTQQLLALSREHHMEDERFDLNHAVAESVRMLRRLIPRGDRGGPACPRRGPARSRT